MNSHKNAKLTARSREEMVRRMRDNPAATVAAGFGVSLRTARKWMKRYREGGVASLAEASSRPRCCRNRLTEMDVAKIFELRKKRQTGDAIALRLGLCRSTVFRALRRLGCSRLSSLEKKEPIRRYRGTLHQDGIERVGIRRDVHPLMEKDSQPAYMDASLQLFASSHGSWQETSGFKTGARVNNVLTLNS